MLFDNLKISRKLAIGFTAVTLTMAGMGGAMLVNLRALDEARIEIKESRETLTALSEAKFYLTRQENSYRGYLLSGELPEGQHYGAVQTIHPTTASVSLLGQLP